MIVVVGLGPGAPEAVPAAALAALGGAPLVLAPPLDPALAAALPSATAPLDLAALPDAAAIAAPDAEAHRIARELPGARTVPGREALRARAIGAEVAALAEVGLRLRRECPWDREQTAETIVPHTVEEAFEVADAVARGGEGLPDELGDLLFQAVFLARLLEEEGAADLSDVARGQAAKLISRHPHVYGDTAAETADGVVNIWESRKRQERSGQGSAPGGLDLFYDLPAGLPALALATKAQKRAAAAGFDHPDAAAALAKLDEEAAELREDPGARELGDVLFAAVAVARAVGADPELALRASAQRFRARVEEAVRLASAAGEDFEALEPREQLRWYESARTSAPGADARRYPVEPGRIRSQTPVRVANSSSEQRSRNSDRTAARWVRRARAKALRPSRVSVATDPRRSSGQGSRRTRPADSSRPTSRVRPLGV